MSVHLSYLGGTKTTLADPIRLLITYGLLVERARRELKVEGPPTAMLRERWRKYLKPGEKLSDLVAEMRAE